MNQHRSLHAPLSRSVRCEVLIAVLLKIQVIWDVMTVSYPRTLENLSQFCWYYEWFEIV